MPDPEPDDTRPAGAAPRRSAAERAGDHRAVERLAGDLLPALIAKLSSGDLAELEVREGDWKVRLRRPLEVIGTGRRATDRQFRLPVAGAASHVATGSTRAAAAGPGSSPTSGAPRPDPGRPAGEAKDPVATSPAVGIFRPRAGLTGSRVRAGDRLGAVDMLGIPQEVVAPIDGIVGRLLAEAGDGVEYGQPLFAMRLAPAGEAGPDASDGTGERDRAAFPGAAPAAPAPAGERT